MHKKLTARLLAILMAMALLTGLAPVQAFAAEGPPEESVIVQPAEGEGEALPQATFTDLRIVPYDTERGFAVGRDVDIDYYGSLNKEVTAASVKLEWLVGDTVVETETDLTNTEDPFNLGDFVYNNFNWYYNPLLEDYGKSVSAVLTLYSDAAGTEEQDRYVSNSTGPLPLRLANDGQGSNKKIAAGEMIAGASTDLEVTQVWTGTWQDTAGNVLATPTDLTTNTLNSFRYLPRNDVAGKSVQLKVKGADNKEYLTEAVEITEATGEYFDLNVAQFNVGQTAGQSDMRWAIKGFNANYENKYPNAGSFARTITYMLTWKVSDDATASADDGTIGTPDAGVSPTLSFTSWPTFTEDHKGKYVYAQLTAYAQFFSDGLLEPEYTTSLVPVVEAPAYSLSTSGSMNVGNNSNYAYMSGANGYLFPASTSTDLGTYT